nr:retron St85 family RNA-directed DNA polymerase [Nonlabens ulvanivorans]
MGVLASMIKAPKSFYRTFKIPKKRGGTRTIVTPHNSLKEIQRWILDNILSQFMIHEAAFAYEVKKNVAMNASIHLGQDEMLKIDLKDFFPSIKSPRIRELFTRVGYSKEVSYFLNALCSLDGCLPQGAVTSPKISNIILYYLDKNLSTLCHNNEVKYSRYADDLVFSANELPINLKSIVSSSIIENGFEINYAKLTEYSSEQRKLVTGIVIKEKGLTLPRSKKLSIRNDVFFLLKYGIEDQIQKYNDIFYLDRVQGRLSYWKQIEPNNKFVLDSIDKLKSLHKDYLNQALDKLNFLKIQKTNPLNNYKEYIHQVAFVASGLKIQIQIEDLRQSMNYLGYRTKKGAKYLKGRGFHRLIGLTFKWLEKQNKNEEADKVALTFINADGSYSYKK